MSLNIYQSVSECKLVAGLCIFYTKFIAISGQAHAEANNWFHAFCYDDDFYLMMTST